MRFGEALEVMRVGCKVRRRSWKRTKHIRLVDDNFWGVVVDEHDSFSRIFEPTTEALLACDWEIVS